MASRLLLQHGMRLSGLILWAYTAQAQIPRPTAPSPQLFCDGSTVANLIATAENGTGLNLLWYPSAGSDTPLSLSTVLQHGQRYYVAEYRNAYLNHVTTLAGGLSVGRSDVVADRDGNLYLTDGNYIKKYDINSQTLVVFSGTGANGSQDGAPNAATFSGPGGLAIDENNNLYVADTGNGKIRLVDKEGNVSTLAGAGGAGDADGPASTALFNSPFGITRDTEGNLYVADFNNHKIRLISGGQVSTLAGNGTQGFSDGIGSAARFAYPIDITIDVNGDLFVADNVNSLVRKIEKGGVVSSIHNTNSTSFGITPTGIAAGPDGNIYITKSNHTIVRLSSNPASGQYDDQTLVGVAPGDIDGVYTEARIGNPQGITIGTDGTIYFAELANKLKKIHLELAPQYSPRQGVDVSLSELAVQATLSSETSATALASGTFSPFTYHWAPTGATTSEVAGLPAGSHTVTVTDAQGCSASSSISVLPQSNALQVTITSSINVTCRGGANGSAAAFASGGNTPYTFVWSTGQTTDVAGNLPAGTHTVTVTDNTGATASTTVTITEPANRPLLSLLGQSEPTCSGLSDGYIDLEVQHGVAPYTYQFLEGSGTIISTGPLSARASDLGAGSYNFRVIDAAGCPGLLFPAGVVALSAPPALAVQITAQTDAGPGAADGTAEAQGSGGISPYTYLWSNGATTAAISGLAPAVYTLSLTDVNGCTAQTSVTIESATPAGLQASITHSSPVSCSGGTDGTATVTATGGTAPYTYLWSGGTTTAMATGLPAGTHSVTVTDATGATDQAEVTLTQPPLLQLTVTDKSHVTCHGGTDGSIDLLAQGGAGPYSFLFLEGTGTITGTGASGILAEGLAAGTYTLQVTDSRGCQAAATDGIISPAPLNIVLLQQTNVSGPGAMDGSASVSASAGIAPITYEWTSGSTGASATGLTEGNHTVTATDANGCQVSLIVSISSPGGPALEVVIKGSTNVSCLGQTDGSALAIGSGGTAPYSYSWSSGATTNTATGLLAGTHTVTITDALGATASTQVTISAPAVLGLFVQAATDISCFGEADGQVNFHVTGGTLPYSYSWVTGSGNLTATSDHTAQGTGMTARLYVARVTDANGCSADRTFALTQPAELTVAITAFTDASSAGASDGTATAEGGGGTPPYTYSWSNGIQTQEVTGLSPGSYTVTLTDASGCQAIATANIGSPGGTPLQVSITGSIYAGCSGVTETPATAVPSGGTAPYTYQWSNGAVSAAVTGLAPGPHSVEVTDANAQTALLSFTILAGSSESFSYLSHTEPQSCGSADGSITFEIPSYLQGSYLMRYKLDGQDRQTTVSVNAGTLALALLAPGTYSDFLIENQQCTHSVKGAVTSVTLTGPAAIGASISPGGPTELCEDEYVSLTASDGVSYLWSNGQTSRSVSVSQAGTYTVTVTSAHGCTSDASIIITQKICNLPPVARCKETVVLVANDDCYAVLTAADLDNGSYDPNSDWTRHTLLNTDGIFRPGEYRVTYEVMDPKGAFSTCESNVRVLDHTPPVARARDLTLELNAAGEATISIADVDAGSYDNCGPVTLSLNRTHFNCSDLGNLQVRLTVTDAGGNVSEALSDIRITDNTPPVITATHLTLPLDETGRASFSSSQVITGISDNCGIWNVAISQNEFTCEHLGENPVTITVEDVRGNRSSAEVIITVTDSTPPLIRAKAVTLYLDSTGAASLSAGMLDTGSRDNCGTVVTEIDRKSFDCRDTGEQGVIFSVTDAAGNRSDTTLSVLIRDTLAPVVRARDITLYLDPNGLAALSPADIDEGSTDNCGIALRTLQQTAFTCSDTGILPVYYRVTDSTGNEAMVTLQVTIKDTLAPETRTLNVVLELDGNGKAALSAQDVDAGSTDNCAISTLTLSQTEFSCTDLGRRLVTLAVEDVSGNRSTERAAVEVKDPNGVCPCSYGVLAFDGILLKNNEVTAGGVGVINKGRKARLRNTVIDQEGTFVKAPQSRFDSESEATIYIRGAAPHPESFRGNPNKDKKKEKTGNDGNLTLAAGRYSKVRAGKNATITFTGGEVFIRDLKVRKNTQLVFSAGTVVLVKRAVKLGKNTALNTGGEQVSIFAGGNTTVGNASEIRAILHSRGNIKTRPGGEITSMEGLFVAEKIRGGKNTHWAGGGVLCTGNNEPEPLPASKKEERLMANSEPVSLTDSADSGIRVKAWPNPVLGHHLNVSVESHTPGGELLLMDVLGNILTKKAYTGTTLKHEVNLRTASPGTYILRVSSGGETKTLRIVKEKRQ